MKINYTETGIHERKAIDKINKVFDASPKTEKWREYADFEFIYSTDKKERGARDLQKFEYDTLVFKHANILILEFKDWYCKKVTKSARNYNYVLVVKIV